MQRDQRSFFDAYAEKQRSRYPPEAIVTTGETSLFYRSRVEAPIAAYLRLLCSALDSNDYLLEFGSGTGYWSRKIHKWSMARVVGVDLSFSSLLLAIDYASEPLPRLLQADGGCLALADESFQAIAIIMVLHHILLLEQTLGELARVTKSGGQLLIFDMTQKNPLIQIGRKLFPHVPDRIKQAFAEDDLVIKPQYNIPETYSVDPGCNNKGTPQRMRNHVNLVESFFREFKEGTCWCVHLAHMTNDQNIR